MINTALYDKLNIFTQEKLSRFAGFSSTWFSQQLASLLLRGAGPGSSFTFAARRGLLQRGGGMKLANPLYVAIPGTLAIIIIEKTTLEVRK